MSDGCSRLCHMCSSWPSPAHSCILFKKKKEGENYLPTYGEQVISFGICEKTNRILLSLGKLKDWAPLSLCTCLRALGELSSNQLLLRGLSWPQSTVLWLSVNAMNSVSCSVVSDSV